MIIFVIKFFLKKIKRNYALAKFRFKWRTVNSHNSTVPINVFKLDGIKIGKYSYGPIHVLRWNTENEGLSIGNFCSIASGVKFILGGNHIITGLSTFPIDFKILGNGKDTISKGPIIIEDDVWIGTDVLVLSGITIGKGSVIAAGSVVTKNVQPYSIVGGNPAKIIKMRFNDDLIESLKNYDMEKWDEEFLRKNRDIFIKQDINRDTLGELR